MKAIYAFFNDANKIIPEDIQSQVIEVIKKSENKIRPRLASRIHNEIERKMHTYGWSEKVRLAANSNITITSVLKQVGMCIQTGNVSRIYADLIKIQTLFIRKTIIAGIIILPENDAAKNLGQNIANRQRLERELKIFSAVITVPLMIIGFDDNQEA